MMSSAGVPPLDSEEGTLSVGKDSISSLNFKQQWSLDATGNWSAFKEDDDGDATWDLEQTRTSNAVNEITDVAETTGPSWITPVYNRAGNTTTVPQPADPTQSYAATYDAWNRLVKLEEGQNTVAEYVFDGAKRLVVRKKYASGSLSQTRHFYHTAGWQTIEERLESGGSILSTADRQFTWGRRYLDDLVCRTVNSVHDHAYQDPNWNVILSSNALARVVYQPYGQIRSTCPAAQGDLDAWQHYFAGYRRDEDTGLYLVRHRVYQPELGCWVQRDPITHKGKDFNLYRYAGNKAGNVVDPSGLDWPDLPCINCVPPRVPPHYTYSPGCKIAVHCRGTNVFGMYFLAEHCGLTLVYLGVTYQLDGSGGTINEIKIRIDNLYPEGLHGMTTGAYTEYSEKVCRCLLDYKDTFNPLLIPRFDTEGNSNWVMSCLVSHCRLGRVNWGQHEKPPGYGVGPCKQWAYEDVFVDPMFPSLCVKVCVGRYQCP